MASGCPVIAFNRGSVPEVVSDGVSGFIVEDEIGAVAAVARLSRLDRATVRADFAARFSAARMAEDYLHLYADIATNQGTRGRAVRDQDLVGRTRTARPLVVVRSS
jgi:glycosyltransferase involved in cell wall biosynthesis